MDKRVFRVKEPDREDGTPGQEIAFSNVEFSPLGYSELEKAILHRPMQISLSGSGMVISSGVDGLSIGQRGRFRTVLNSPFTSKCIGLVSGGWLPSLMALEDNSIMLPDRCVVAQLNARLKNGATKPQAEPDFVDLFADSPIRINPLLFVLEGDDGQNPTPEAAVRHLHEAVSKLRSALPKAVMVAANDQGLKGVLGLVKDTQLGIARKQGFLERLNPMLKSPVSKKKVRSLCDAVLAAAQECDIPIRSLVVLAALSSIVVSNGQSPARRMLKFKGEYTSADAYNALADLRSLEILMYTFALFPDQRVMLCTADKDMALFWAGLRASNFAFSCGRLSFDIAPGDLLPGLPADFLKTSTGS